MTNNGISDLDRRDVLRKTTVSSVVAIRLLSSSGIAAGESDENAEGHHRYDRHSEEWKDVPKAPKSGPTRPEHDYRPAVDPNRNNTGHWPAEQTQNPHEI